MTGLALAMGCYPTELSAWFRQNDQTGRRQGTDGWRALGWPTPIARALWGNHPIYKLEQLSDAGHGFAAQPARSEPFVSTL